MARNPGQPVDTYSGGMRSLRLSKKGLAEIFTGILMVDWASDGSSLIEAGTAFFWLMHEGSRGRRYNNRKVRDMSESGFTGFQDLQDCAFLRTVNGHLSESGFTGFQDCRIVLFLSTVNGHLSESGFTGFEDLQDCTFFCELPFV